MLTTTKIKTEESKVLVHFPHSGTNIPQEILATMDPAVVASRPDTDWNLPEVYKPFIKARFSSVEALMHRYVVDLNRNPTGESLYSDNRYISQIVPKKTFSGENIYLNSARESNTAKRVEDFFWPHHRALEGILKKEETKLLVDAHSIARNVPSLFKGNLPDIILGNGAELETAPLSWLEQGAATLEKEGFSVSINTPFRGGWITRSYPERVSGLRAIQIEMCNDLYLDGDFTGPTKQAQTSTKGFKKTNKNKALKLQKALDLLLQVWNELAIKA